MKVIENISVLVVRPSERQSHLDLNEIHWPSSLSAAALCLG
jgi:hypothetical protein